VVKYELYLSKRKLMKINLLAMCVTASLTLMSSSVFSQTNIFRMTSGTADITISAGTVYFEGYNPQGFDVNGTHRDTGTLFSPEGYDMSGYDALGYGVDDLDINGVGREECRFNGYYYSSTSARKPSGLNSYVVYYRPPVFNSAYKTTLSFVWDDVGIGSKTRTTYPWDGSAPASPTQYTKDGYLYTIGDYISNFSVTNTQGYSYGYRNHQICRQKV
jgi:hypothetical protein